VRSVFRLLSILIALALAVYAGDYISVRYGIPKGRARLMFQPPQAEQCVYSLFPQLGAAPCWYLERHATQKIDE